MTIPYFDLIPACYTHVRISYESLGVTLNLYAFLA